MPKKKELEDERFSQISWHPKFRRVPRQVRKVKIDKRFESMFKDPNFKLKHAVDKRGRPLGQTSTEDLRRYYDMSSSESENEEEEDGSENKEKVDPSVKTAENDDDNRSEEIEENSDQGGSEKESDEDESEQESSDAREVEKEEEEEIKFDLARGEGNISSSTDDSSSEWEFEDGDESTLHDWNDVDANQAPAIENSTSRLAICNMDWEKITARDLLILLNSFKPSSGNVSSVKIYPSDFGLQRMNEEQKHGPVELRELKEESGDESDDDDDERGPKSFLDKAQEERQRNIMLEKLRQYEFNRLKYYYAVAECDSVATAEHVYSNCDGMEYEISGTRLDLRFIPDDTVFDDRQPKDEASSFGDLTTYNPTVFVNKALQQSRPTLTWEEERDPKRVELTKKAFENPQEWDRLELNGVLASPSSSEASDGEDVVDLQEEVDGGEASKDEPVKQEGHGKSRKKDGYKSLLLDSLKDTHVRPGKIDGEDDNGMEMEIKWDANVEEKLEKADKLNEQGDNKKSPWEKYMEKRKEKRRQRKEEIRQKRLAIKRQREGRTSEDDDFPSDFEDEPRIAQKSKKRNRPSQQQVEEEDGQEEKKKQEAELELLLADSDEETKHRHFSLKKLLKKDKKSVKPKGATSNKAEEDEEDFNMDLEDPRFKAVFNSHLYNIDPSDPAFKKTPGMQRLVQEKFKTKSTKAVNRGVTKMELVKEDQAQPSAMEAQNLDDKPTNPDLSLLAKKVKAKTDMLRKEKERRNIKKARS